MTIQTVPRSYFPDWRASRLNSTAFSTTFLTLATLDGASDAVMWAGDSPVTDSLTVVYFRTGVVSVTSGPLNFEVRIETVSNGRPTGTLYDTNTSATVAIADTDDNVWKTATLTAAASLTRGTPFAIVIKAPGSGTFSVIIAGVPPNSGTQPICANWPVCGVDTDGNGTYDSMVVASAPCLVPKIGSTPCQLEGCAPWDSLAISNFNSSSTPDAKALRYNDAVPRRVIGVEVLMANVSAGSDFTFSIFPDSGSSQSDADALAQTAHDGDGTVGTTQDGWVQRFFASAVTLSANTTYWIEVRADTANNLAVVVATVPSISAFLVATPGGSSCYLGTRSWSAGSAPAYTQDSTSVPFIRLIVDGLDDGAGGGSSAVLGAPNLRGNMQ
jgi:hypothetical protein